MIDTKLAPYAALLLRLALAAMLLAHAGLKIFVFTPAGAVKFFGSLGVPEYGAYGIMAFEVIAAAALILGVFSRWVALAVAVELMGTIVLVHGPRGWLFSSQGGGWEYPAFMIAAALALALLGNGAYALSKSSSSAPS
jgi:putative oxidoreductase